MGHMGRPYTTRKIHTSSTQTPKMKSGMTYTSSFRDVQTQSQLHTHTKHTHTHTLAETHSLVYRMSNIADALDWPCRLLRRYGFMLHHRGVSFSVDYNSQKPLIKPCAAKPLFLFFYNYLSPRVKPSDLLTKSHSAVESTNKAKYLINCPDPPPHHHHTIICLN